MSQRPGIVVRAVTGLVPLAFTIGGALLAWNGTPRVLEGLASRSWAEAQGRVTESAIAEVDPGGRGPGTKRWYEVRITYEFDAAGAMRSGSRVGLSPIRRVPTRAKEMADSLSRGTGVQVYYDPANPSRSLLDRSIGALTWAMVVGGAAMLALGVLMLVGYSRALRRLDG